MMTPAPAAPLQFLPLAGWAGAHAGSAAAPLPIVAGAWRQAGAGHVEAPAAAARRAVRVEVRYPAGRAAGRLAGRLLLMLSTDTAGAPRFQISDGPSGQLVFGLDVEGWAADAGIAFTDTVSGFPLRRLGELPPGRYRAQLILNRYETFRLSTGRTVLLPPKPVRTPSTSEPIRSSMRTRTGTHTSSKVHGSGCRVPAAATGWAAWTRRSRR